ncbi:MAG: hypothetical protein ACREEM_12890 [Blastocatellia bacterium]
MAMSLQIIQAKPNPAGKEKKQDKNESGAANPEQLLGEWVDIENIGNDSVHFSTIQLRHTLFDQFCYATGPELYWAGGVEDYLKPGQVLRVHAGRQSDAHLAAAEDQTGADWHGYAGGESFILNNRCGDKMSVTWRDAFDQSFLDWVCYAPHPPEDTILKRSGNLLAGAAVGLTF